MPNSTLELLLFPHSPGQSRRSQSPSHRPPAAGPPWTPPAAPSLSAPRLRRANPLRLNASLCSLPSQRQSLCVPSAPQTDVWLLTSPRSRLPHGPHAPGPTSQCLARATFQTNDCLDFLKSSPCQVTCPGIHHPRVLLLWAEMQTTGQIHFCQDTG